MGLSSNLCFCSSILYKYARSIAYISLDHVTYVITHRCVYVTVGRKFRANNNNYYY